MGDVLVHALLALDEKLSMMLLSKISIDMLSEHFALIFLNIYSSRSDECFEYLLQRLKSSPELLMGKYLFANKYDCNCLMIATANTHHFFKLMELYDKEDLMFLLHQRDRRGVDSLSLACTRDNGGIVQFLLTNFEYDLSFVDEEGYTIITLLVGESNLQILQYIFDRRKTDAIAASKIITETNRSFLFLICLFGEEELLHFFMKRRKNEPPLLSQIFPFPEYAKHLFDCISIVRFSTEAKAKIVAKRLIVYISNKIIDENLPLNDCAIRGSKGETLLMVATICTDTLQSLLHLADAQNVLSELLAETDIFGNSILRWACIYGNLDSIKLLITQYKINWRTDVDNRDASLIHGLCRWGNIEVEIPRNFFKSLFHFRQKSSTKVWLKFFSDSLESILKHPE